MSIINKNQYFFQKNLQNTLNSKNNDKKVKKEVKEHKNIKIDVLICTPDEKLQRFQKTINSLKNTTKGIDYRLCVKCNNWSKDFWVVKEFNDALEDCGEYLLILDDDVYFEDNKWLHQLIDVMVNNPDIHIAGTDLYRTKAQYIGGGVIIDPITGNVDFIKEKYEENQEYRVVPAIGTCTALIRKTGLKFDEIYKHYYVDPDYCLAGWEMGYKTVVVPVRTYHEVDNLVMSKNNKNPKNMIEVGRQIFCGKWCNNGRLLKLYNNVISNHTKYVPKNLKDIRNPVYDIDVNDARYIVNFVHYPDCDGAIYNLLGYIRDNAPDDVSITSSHKNVDNQNTINYHVVWHMIQKNGNKHCKQGIDVLFCPHPDNRTCYPELKKASHCTFMCEKYYNEAIKFGVDKNKCTLIYPSIDDMYIDNRLVLFAPQWTHNRGTRKGANIWDALCKIPWLRCVTTEGKMTKEELLLWYRACDVVIATGTVEGGPMSLVEAVALGKPIVAGKGVGLTNEFAHYADLCDIAKIDSILAILKKYHQDKIDRLSSIWYLDSKRYAYEHWQLFDRLITNQKVDN